MFLEPADDGGTRRLGPHRRYCVRRGRRCCRRGHASWRRSLSAAAGLSRITFHDLRHSYATGALRAGVNPKVISERIGYANVGFFLETYAHVLENDDREAAKQAAGFLIGDAWADDDDADPTDLD